MSRFKIRKRLASRFIGVSEEPTFRTNLDEEGSSLQLSDWKPLNPKILHPDLASEHRCVARARDWRLVEMYS